MTGLKPQTTYCVKMAAENAAGRGPFCEPLPVQTSEYQLFYSQLQHVALIQFGYSYHTCVMCRALIFIITNTGNSINNSSFRMYIVH